MNIVVAVTTAPRAVNYLPATLDSLSEAGLGPSLVVAEPGSSVPGGYAVDQASKTRGSWPAFLGAIRGLLATHPRADAYAVFQDDVLLSSPTLGGWLAEALWPRPVVEVGVVSLYSCGATEATWSPKPGWLEIPHESIRKTYGALAIILPPGSARALVASPPGPGCRSKTDHFLGQHCLWTGTAWLQHWPSLVRHIGATSAITGGHRGLGRNRREG